MYEARVIESVDNGSGYWDYVNVGIYEKGSDVLLGQYQRKYPYRVLDTFHPFKHKNGKWYAIYSEDYTCTYLMELPSCTKIGGEPGWGGGFCPMEYYIPRYYKLLHPADPNAKEGTGASITSVFVMVDDDYSDEKFEKEYLEIRDKESVNTNLWAGYELVSEIEHLPFAFISGCVWGDDSSAKIQMIDLRRADEGIITRFAPFGYLELASSGKIRDDIDNIDIETANTPPYDLEYIWSIRFRVLSDSYTIGMDDIDGKVEEGRMWNTMVRTKGFNVHQEYHDVVSSKTRELNKTIAELRDQIKSIETEALLSAYDKCMKFIADTTKEEHHENQ